MVLSLRHMLGKQLVNLVTTFVIQLSNVLVLGNLFGSFAGSSVDTELELREALAGPHGERCTSRPAFHWYASQGIEAARPAYQNHSHPFYLLPFYLYC